MAIAETLAKADPTNTEWQRDVAMSHGKIGLVHQQRGERDEARRAFEAGRAIMAKLVKLDPSNAGWKRDLALFESQLR